MFTSMFRSDKADIHIVFTSGARDPYMREVPRFLPGEAISGYVEIRPAENFNFRKIVLRIKWRTEGRGDTDTVQWAEITQPGGSFRAGIVETIPFSAVLPSEPWSYSGHYITIVWGVEVDIDVAWKTNPRHFAPFVLAPDWTRGEIDNSPPHVKPSER